MEKPDRELRRRRFPLGTEMVRQGERGDRAWLLENGRVDVLVTGTRGDTHKVASVGRGAIIGEMALIDDGPRSATVQVIAEVDCLELDRETFKLLLSRCQPLGAYLLESLVAAIRRAYGLPPGERVEGGAIIRSVRDFTKILDRRVYAAGHVFFNQDDPATTAYLIQSGRVSILRRGERGMEELGPLGPGRIFGELALLNADLRRATAAAATQTVCEVVTKETFDAVIAAMPPILRALTKIYVGQLSAPPKALLAPPRQ
ncbi:MAG: cyclic nucleotide-binding domain-containing protein [Rhodospirillaceae bacterium]